MAAFYCLVEFTKEQSIAVISSKWLTENDQQCYWPTGPRNVTNLAKNHTLPNKSWKPHLIRIKQTYANFEAAIAASRTFEDTSNLESSAAEGPSPLHTRRLKAKIKKNRSANLVLVGSPTNQSTSSSDPPSDTEPSNVPPPPPPLSASAFLNEPNEAPSQPTHGTLDVRRQTQTPTPLREVQTRPRILASQLVTHSPSGFANSSELQGVAELAAAVRELSLRQERFEDSVTQYLVKIVNNQKELLRKTADPADPVRNAILPVTFPISSLEDYQKLNEWLQSEENLTTLVKELAIVGGANIQDITSRVMGTVFSNKLAVDLSFTGKGARTKAGLKDTKFLSLIYGAVRCTRNGQKEEYSAIDVCIRKWLKGASDRDGGREARRNKACQLVKEPTENRTTANQSELLDESAE